MCDIIKRHCFQLYLNVYYNYYILHIIVVGSPRFCFFFFCFCSTHKKDKTFVYKTYNCCFFSNFFSFSLLYCLWAGLKSNKCLFSCIHNSDAFCILFCFFSVIIFFVLMNRLVCFLLYKHNYDILYIISY